MANEISILDFDLFFESMKAMAKLVDAAKLQFSPNGLAIYGARGMVARCEMTTNAVSSADEFEFCIDDINTFNRVLNTAKEVHKDDFSELSISYSRPNLQFKSKKLKLKYATIQEAVIANWISKKLTADMAPVFQFKTTSDMIKRINSHSFMFSDSKSLRIKLETKDDMESNSVFATLMNSDTAVGNEITLKFGLVTDGVLPEGRKMLIDIERANLFNCVQSDNISIALMNLGCLLSKTHVTGENGSYFNIDIYCTLMKG